MCVCVFVCKKERESERPSWVFFFLQQIVNNAVAQIGWLPDASCGGCCFRSRVIYALTSETTARLKLYFIHPSPSTLLISHFIPLCQFVFILCLLSHPPASPSLFFFSSSLKLTIQ